MSGRCWKCQIGDQTQSTQHDTLADHVLFRKANLVSIEEVKDAFVHGNSSQPRRD